MSRHRRKPHGFFDVWNSVVRGGWLADMTGNEVKVWLVLMSFFGRKDGHRDEPPNIVWPSLNKIAKRAGMPVCGVTRALKALGKLRAIKTKSQGGFFGENNDYRQSTRRKMRKMKPKRVPAPMHVQYVQRSA